MKEKGTLCYTVKNQHPIVVRLDDDINILIIKKGSYTKVVIEAPKEVQIKRLKEVEEAIKANS